MMNRLKSIYRNSRAVIRFVLFFALTFGIYWLWLILDPFKTDKRKWREWIFRNWARQFGRILGMKIQISGKIPQPPFFLVSNHLSYVDIAVIRSVCECVFVAKADLQRWFLAGTIIGSFGTIFINRENRRDIPRAGQQIIETLERGEGVAVFPEGTSSGGAEVLPFNSSFLEFAAQKNLPVHFAAIRYETPENERIASESVCWWRPEDDFAPHFFQLLKIPTFNCTLVFGEQAIESNDRKDLAQKLRQSVKMKFVPMP